MPPGDPSTTSQRELAAFEAATADLAGLALRSVENLDVSLPQFRLLLVLHDRGPTGSTQCAQALGVAGSSVTRLADRLHASGHLVRGTDPANRSVVTLELTEHGRRVVQEVVARRRRQFRRVLDRLDPADRSAATAALEKLHDLLGPDTADDARGHLPL